MKSGERGRIANGLHWSGWLSVGLLLVMTGVMGSAWRDDPPVGSDKEREFFRSEVLPLLRRHCFRCHGGEAKVQGGLVLTRRQGILDGGDSGDAVDLIDAESSLLLKSVLYEGLEMPPDRRLSGKEIEVIEKWIELGLPYEGDHSYQPQ